VQGKSKKDVDSCKEHIDKILEEGVRQSMRLFRCCGHSHCRLGTCCLACHANFVSSFIPTLRMKCSPIVGIPPLHMHTLLPFPHISIFFPRPQVCARCTSFYSHRHCRTRPPHRRSPLPFFHTTQLAAGTATSTSTSRNTHPCTEKLHLEMTPVPGGFDLLEKV